MKKLIAFFLILIMALSLAACGEEAEKIPPESTDSGTSEQEPSNTTPEDTDSTDSETQETDTPEEGTPESLPGEVTDFDIGISAIPAEWQKAIGNSLYGMNTGADGDYSDSYINKFGDVSAEDYAKLISYFDTLSYTEKLDGVYNCDWGQLQIGHNAEASEMTISWYAN